MKVILEIKDEHKNGLSKELGLLLKGVVTGLWSIPFPSPKPTSREFWCKCPNCDRWHRFHFPIR